MNTLEALELRRHFSAAKPTDVEQLNVEIINRARANPSAEAASFGINLNEGLDPGTIKKSAKQPLAINLFLTSAARKYSTTLLDPGNPVDGQLNHLINGTSPSSRATAEGFAHGGVGENLAYSTSGASSPSIDGMNKNHTLLFKDFTDSFEVVGRGHRKNILRADYVEIGVGLKVGQFGGRNAEVVTQDFGTDAGNQFLTGVAITDNVADDDFYTVGEGLDKVTITAVDMDTDQEFTTKTWGSGGYSMQLPAGRYGVTAEGGNIGAAQVFKNVVIGDINVKLDFTKPGTTDKTAPWAPKSSVIADDIVVAGGDDHTFTITYNDNHGVKRTSIGDGDVKVFNKKYEEVATLVSKTSKGNSIIATYSIPAPDGEWDSEDSRTYKIQILKGEVKDTSGKNVAAGKVGSFVVDVSGAAFAASGFQSDNTTLAQSGSANADELDDDIVFL